MWFRANCTFSSHTIAHAVSAAGGASYAYDCNGNMITRTFPGTPPSTYNLSYDVENRLVGVSGPVTATFTYDGDGNRVVGTVSGATTVYIGGYFEWTATNMKKYYSAGGTTVAMKDGNTLYYVFTDHLGSTSLTANADGSLNSEMRFKAWGETRFASGTTPTAKNYTGQYNDSYINLYWIGSRWYDPTIGRWTQPDTDVPESQGVLAFDRYAYCSNNPTNLNDPTGHMAELGTEGGGFDQNEVEQGYRNTALQIITNHIKSANEGGTTTNYAGLAPWEQSALENAGCSADCYNDAVTTEISTADPVHDPLTYIETIVLGTGLISAGLNLLLPASTMYLFASDTNGLNLYRGGPLDPSLSDVRINKLTGFLESTYGVSLNLDPNKVAKFGIPNLVTFIPEGLTIIQRGKDLGHYEIVPTPGTFMTFAQYAEALKQVIFAP